MKATNLIKINGVWYRAGDELPASRKPDVKPTAPDLKVETGEPKKTTREDIEDMKYFSLVSLAKEKGIAVENKKADIIRKELIEAMGL